MSLFKAVNELCDVVSLLIYCPEDKTLLLTLEGSSTEYSIPCSKVTPGDGWYGNAMQEVEETFGIAIRSAEIIRVCKVWAPNEALSSVFHSIFRVCINEEQKKKTRNISGKYRGKIRWVNDSIIQKMLVQQNLKSPEIVLLMRQEPGDKSAILQEMTPAHDETPSCGILSELSQKTLISPLTSSSWDMLLNAAGFNGEVQTELYKEFIVNCFPYTYMSQQTFIKFCLNLGCAGEEGKHLFRAADITDRKGISYHEFMYIIAALDPNVAHVNAAADIRSIFIYRYFDCDGDGLLSFLELKSLITTIYKFKKLPTDSGNFNKEVEDCFKSVSSLPNATGVTLQDFLKAIEEMKIKGTSQLLRSSKDVFTYLRNVQQREVSSVVRVKANESDTKLLKRVAMQRLSGKPSPSDDLEPPDDTSYELAMHTLSILRGGSIYRVNDVCEVSKAMTPSSTNINSNVVLKRESSVAQFNENSIATELLKSLRNLMELNRDTYTTSNEKCNKKKPYNWGQFDPGQFARSLIIVCNLTRKIMESEPRLLEVRSPAYVIGDIHGNFADLLYFEKVFWQLGPHICPCRLIFLGDYVDRGAFGLEVVTYLFCNKVRTPRKVLLLRGNHEIREIQLSFTFCSEVVDKLGNDLAADVWNAVNCAFDAMPLAAVIDTKVFCCHGGIPPPWMCPTASAINSIPVPLSNPFDQSSLAWDLMWNDPIKQKGKQVSHSLLMELIANEGFAVNTNRGTGHVFTTEALERFLNVNGFSHIIRAHEVAQSGFNIQQNARLLTVFSSSLYCGGSNEAACILADCAKLRVIRLETG